MKLLFGQMKLALTQSIVIKSEDSYIPYANVFKQANGEEQYP